MSPRRHIFPSLFRRRGVRPITVFQSMLFALIFAFACVGVARHVADGDDDIAGDARNHPGGMRLKRATKPKLWCVNGTEMSGKCVCMHGYVGTHCERRMQCLSYERNAEGACVACKPNYEGTHCDHILCEHGTADEYEQKCICDKPFTGEFCDQLTTKNIYYYYNSQVAKIGPLGVFIVIPMLLVYYGCEHFAKKRQIRRIEKTWCDQTKVSVDSGRIKNLLNERP